ncbi:MAG TPA: DUF523 domain-containing protein [Candidatus Cloacimonas sp.]|jgi:uncharacterized protein YbbK (DUF523 family)|nr:hypothetical protein [Candidatus Cloacimonadota bacterium]HCX73465.1 DUF523 domain-containing protein [Candidatus Cloacimonas sp.]
MEKYLVSACLAGVNCTYRGDSNLHPKVVELFQTGCAWLVCPEQLGGLPTPRPPAEILGNKILMKDGRDVTKNFVRGAQEALRLAKLLNIKKAILKQRSPSCGYGQIYDGSHSGKIIAGMGVTATLLQENGIEIISEDKLNSIFL